jgi:ABC-2 type transport system permease protein
MSLRRVWVQCAKELVQFRRDRLTVALAFALPLGMLLIFGFAIRLQLHDVPVAIQDFDRTPLSRAFADRIAATQELRPSPAAPERAPLEVLGRTGARAVIVIPPGTQADLAVGRPVRIQVLVDGSDVVNALFIQNAIGATVDFMQATLGAAPPTRIQAATRTWFNPGAQESLLIVPGVYAIILSMYPAMLAAMAMVRDKERGTIVQAYASRLRAVELIGGKLLAFWFVALLEAIVIMGVGRAIWGLHVVGDPLPLLIATPIYLCDSVLFGLMVGAATTSIGSAIEGVGAVNALFSILLSGFLYPISTMPWILQQLSYLVPARHYIALTRDAFVRGAGWSNVAPEPLALALLGLVFFTVAWLRLRRMQFAG